MRRALWLVMTVLATGIAAYAAAVLLVPGFGPPFVTARRAMMPLALAAHLAGGLVALAVGAWQANARLRARMPAVHRWMGRTYVVAVLAGGLGGLRLAVASEEGWPTHLGFGALAVALLFTTLRGWMAIRGGAEERHRAWMIRSYALTLAAVTLRIQLPLALAAGIPFADAYRAIAWLSWVPNLVVAEWLVRRTHAVAIPAAA
jgi:uncharacterized membrane protein